TRPGEYRYRDHEHENGDAETKDRAECLTADISKRFAAVIAVGSTPLGQRAQQPGKEQQHDNDCRHAPPPVRGEILQAFLACRDTRANEKCTLRTGEKK